VRAGGGMGIAGLFIAWAAWSSSPRVVVTTMLTELTRREAGLQAELHSVVQTLRRGAGVGHDLDVLVGVGVVRFVAARPHGGVGRFQVGAVLRVDPAI